MRLLSVLLLVAAPWVSAGDKPPQAAIASASPHATEAGLEILARGGNAFDAAVAVSSVLAVTEPYGSGMGGGGFWLLHRALDGFQVMVDGREVAPGAASRDMYLDENGEPIPRLSIDGPLAAGIPGAPAGWVHIATKYGRLSLAESLAPAIRLARDGFPASKHMVRNLTYKKDLMNRWPAAAEIFYRNGEPPTEGELLVQPDLAATLTAVAGQGIDGFYKGEVARSLVEGTRAAGGIWTLEDLASYRVRERRPVYGNYRGHRIVSAPPPSSGGVLIINALNILAGFNLAGMDQLTQKHLVVEAMRRAFRDRAEYLGDPDYVDIPLERLAHPFYAAGQRAAILVDRATPSDALPGIVRPDLAGGTQTTHFSVLDRDGNRVAGTMSINFWFGSGFMPPGTGVLLNNEMDDFSIKPGVPNGYELVGADANAIAPGKRMLSSMTPTFIESDDGVAILGTPGGSRIISMVLLGSLARINGADARAMVSLPRFHHQYLPDRITFEDAAFDGATRDGLESMGHNLQLSSRNYGNLQAITWDYATGKVVAAADPRGEG
ncbi:MAG: gamma-glutamyltransferase, partial [Gammaproteobacteria bacterium]|nr:gamma-glutamyltransferase [Gammaproteobacteria bacterium]